MLPNGAPSLHSSDFISISKKGGRQWQGVVTSLTRPPAPGAGQG
jgi:hypothetical protein